MKKMLFTFLFINLLFISSCTKDLPYAPQEPVDNRGKIFGLSIRLRSADLSSRILSSDVQLLKVMHGDNILSEDISTTSYYGTISVYNDGKNEDQNKIDVEVTYKSNLIKKSRDFGKLNGGENFSWVIRL